MDSVKTVKDRLEVGYTFMFKGEHCTVTCLHSDGFEYKTATRPSGNFMNYWFFATIPHYRSRFHNYPKPKTVTISEDTFKDAVRVFAKLLAEKSRRR